VEEIDERALPRSARPDERDDLSFSRGEVDVLEHAVRFVREINVLEDDRLAQRVDALRPAIRSNNAVIFATCVRRS